MTKALIVEDNAESLYMLQVLLATHGYEVVTAVNGDQALKHARTEKPDVIISDILMPVMDGFTLCRQCKADEQLRRIPFVFYTATYTDPKDEELALSLGAERFLVKPVEPENLLEIVEQVLEKRGDDVKLTRDNQQLEEREVLGLYNERLVRKLEKKMLDLEREVAVRTRAEQELSRMRGELERRVHERTEQLARANRDLEDQIRERQRAEQRLLEAKETAENASRAKSEFLAGMSHELRTPLNHIIGFTELVVDKKYGDLTPVQEEYLNDVLASGRHLLSLINDILDLSKVEAGKLELELSPVNLRSVLDSSLMMVKETALKHGIRVFLRTGAIPETLNADERKLKQILYNLVSNAVKFTGDGGEICVSARTWEKDDRAREVAGRDTKGRQGAQVFSPQWVLICVEDNGVGLRKEDTERIFKPFEQVEYPTQNTPRGTGLGLSLARRLVELHGGRIWAESGGPGKGAAFRFTLPIQGLEGAGWPTIH